MANRLEDENDGFDQSQHDKISEFTSTAPYKIGLDPDSWAYDLDFPFPEDDGDPNAPAWCVWEGCPTPMSYPASSGSHCGRSV